METQEERKKRFTVNQIDEVSLLLSKVRALANAMNQAEEYSYLNRHTVMTLTTDILKNLDRIEATLGI